MGQILDNKEGYSLAKMAKNRWFKFWTKSKAIGLQNWANIDSSNFGQKVRLQPCKNGQKSMSQILDKK